MRTMSDASVTGIAARSQAHGGRERFGEVAGGSGGVAIEEIGVVDEKIGVARAFRRTVPTSTRRLGASRCLFGARRVLRSRKPDKKSTTPRVSRLRPQIRTDRRQKRVAAEKRRSCFSTSARQAVRDSGGGSLRTILDRWERWKRRKSEASAPRLLLLGGWPDSASKNHLDDLLISRRRQRSSEAHVELPIRADVEIDGVE